MTKESIKKIILNNRLPFAVHQIWAEFEKIKRSTVSTLPVDKNFDEHKILKSSRSKKTSKQIQDTCERLVGVSGSLDKRCPALIEAALIDAGWCYRGIALGWTKDQIAHYYYWEIPAAQIIFSSDY